MPARSSTLDGFVQGLLYRGREGHLSFIGHRLGGIGLVLFLTIHIADTSLAYFWPAGYSHAIDLYRTVPLMLGEMVLVAAALFHGVNGLNIIFRDTFPHLWSKRAEASSFWRVLGVTGLLWLPTAFIMGRSLYVYNFCRTCNESVLSPAAVAARTNFVLAAVPILYLGVLGVLVWGASLRRPAVKRQAGILPQRTLETYAWLFMRLSGVLLIPLVWGHVLIQDVAIGVHAIDVAYVAARWGHRLWQVYDIALLALAFGHGIYGLWGIAVDYVHRPGLLKAVRLVCAGVWVVLTVIGAWAVVGLAVR